jgi:hypothetical protein
MTTPAGGELGEAIKPFGLLEMRVVAIDTGTDRPIDAIPSCTVQANAAGGALVGHSKC